MTKFVKGGGNVFRDLGFRDAGDMLARAELARRIGKIVIARKLTQAKAASLLGIDQPKISALLNGRLAGFSTGRLMRFLKSLGQDVEIVVRQKARGAGRIRVAAE